MLTVQATYENGVLKPASALPFREHEKVELIVHSLDKNDPASADAERIVRQSHGILGWTGDAETLRLLAESSEFDPQEGP